MLLQQSCKWVHVFFSLILQSKKICRFFWVNLGSLEFPVVSERKWLHAVYRLSPPEISPDDVWSQVSFVWFQLWCCESSCLSAETFSGAQTTDWAAAAHGVSEQTGINASAQKDERGSYLGTPVQPPLQIGIHWECAAWWMLHGLTLPYAPHAVLTVISDLCALIKDLF